MMFSSRLDVGDWVRAVRPVRITISDIITGEGIEAGTRGVVIARSASLLVVAFDTGFGGTTRARVPAHQLKLIRRRGGTARFLRNARTTSTVRLALRGFLLYPFAEFCVHYLLQNGSFDELVPAVALATFESLGDWIVSAVREPIPAVVHAGFLTLLSWIAFPTQRSCKEGKGA